MTPHVDHLSEIGALREVVIKHPADAFIDRGRIEREWQALNFSAAPDLGRAVEEFDRFAQLLATSGATVRHLPRDAAVTLDSIYARDASVESPHGMVLCRMGKALRMSEADAQRRAFLDWGVAIAGEIRAPGTLEGGDVVWLSARVVAVGRGYRTNDEGIRQFRELLGDRIDELIVVPLPHWRGHGDVFHLMSVISPVDRDLAVVYAPLLPVPFRERLDDLGFRYVEVPDKEWESMGANVLALAPGRCLMLDGNPETRARLDRAGADVSVYSGLEISVKGGGGPTCLTRPIVRAAVPR